MRNATTSETEALNSTSQNDDTLKPFGTRGAEKIMLSVLAVSSFYVAICTVAYQSRKQRRAMLWTNRMCTAAAVGTFGIAASYSYDVFGSGYTDALCFVFNVFSYIFFLSNKAIVFHVLWLRQKTLYDESGFVYNRLQMGAIRFMQYAAVAINGLSLACGVYMWTATPRYATARGCEVLEPLKKWLLILIFGPFIVAQIILVVLTAIPVIKHLRVNWRSQNPTSRAEALVYRVSSMTVLYVVSDIAFLVFVAIATSSIGVGPSYSFVPVLQTYNVLLNTVGVLFSFRDYRDRLWPGKPTYEAS